VVERITFQNPENGFTVARLAPERPEAEAEAARGEDRLVTVVGTLADLAPGEVTRPTSPNSSSREGHPLRPTR
jgi:hypothetical protein